MSKVFKYNSKLVGVTFEGRQAIISTLEGKEALQCRREADNQYDSNAVAVDALVGKEWLPIGFIAKDKNEQIAKAMDCGEEIKITLSNVTGGNGKSFGVNIALEYKEGVAKAKPAEPKTVKKEVKKPTKAEVSNVLEYLLGAVNAPQKAVEAPRTYNSVLLGKNIEVQEKDGHRRLEGFLSGSKFPAQFYGEFDKDNILSRMVEKFSLTKEQRHQIETMWDINSKASTGYGNAVHYAMENYDRNHIIGDKLKKVETFKTKPDRVGPNKALNRNPLLKKLVESFHELFGGDYMRFNEEFIWNKEFKLCGSVDRIKVIDMKKRIIRIQDFKTDADINETKYQLASSPFYPLTQGDNPTMGKTLLDYHWLQLSFYAFILELAGWKVEGLDVYWVNAEKLVNGENPWEEFSHDVIDISKVIIGE